MNVLGLFAFGMNPGACLLRDGELIAFAEEERFDRFKTSPDLFPGRTTAGVLSDRFTDGLVRFLTGHDRRLVPVRYLDR